MALKIKRKVERPEGDGTEVDGESVDAGAESAPLEGDVLPPRGASSAAPVTAPDEVLLATSSLFDKLVEHRNKAIGALVAVAVVGIGVAVTRDLQRASAIEGAASVLAASATQFSEVGDGSGSPLTNLDQSQARPARRYASLDALWGEVSTQAQSAGDLPAAKLVLAGAQVALGSGDAAAASYEAAQPALRPGDDVITRLGAATAQAEAGKLADATASLDKLASEQPSYAFTAQLLKARLVDAYGKPEEALEAWRGLVKDHPSAKQKDVAENRVAQLEIELGKAPVAAPPVEGSGK